ncbi:hypothetical protein MPEAHAMD_4047 [Methylobacterium frigidaeris]|uniref:Uncharacterized protein n=1 Tax=Methylobacterium frigidaeris TaxID=2038277 RepID=A0AA37HE43_9HYPH|nr:hypothetical protein MPEAHAMD_4047 [Methylobacterium frigidaeris]
MGRRSNRQAACPPQRISHLPEQVPYGTVERPPVYLHERVRKPDYVSGEIPVEMYMPARY